MTKKECLYLMVRLQTAFPNHPADKAMFDLYFEFMDRAHYEDALEAINAWISGHDWFPTINQLLEEIGEQKRLRTSTPEPLSEIEYQGPWISHERAVEILQKVRESDDYKRLMNQKAEEGKA